VCWCCSHSLLGTDVRFASSRMDVIDWHEVLWQHSDGIDPFLACYRVNYSTGLVPQLRLWCPCRPWVTCIHVCCRSCSSWLAETLLQSLKPISVGMTWTMITQRIISEQQYQLGYYLNQGLRAHRSIRPVCIGWQLDHSWLRPCSVCLEYTKTRVKYCRETLLRSVLPHLKRNRTT
jgi:hypothetical protein